MARATATAGPPAIACQRRLRCRWTQEVELIGSALVGGVVTAGARPAPVEEVPEEGFPRIRLPRVGPGPLLLSRCVITTAADTVDASIVDAAAGSAALVGGRPVRVPVLARTFEVPRAGITTRRGTRGVCVLPAPGVVAVGVVLGGG